MTYHHELPAWDGSGDALRAHMRKQVIGKVCGEGDAIRVMRDDGITYRYSYTAPKMDRPVFVDVNIAECRALGSAG